MDGPREDGVLGGKPMGMRRGDPELDEAGVTWRELWPLGGPLLGFAMELVLKAGSEEALPDGPPRKYGRECTAGMVAGADVECGMTGREAGLLGGGTMSESRDPMRSHA